MLRTSLTYLTLCLLVLVFALGQKKLVTLSDGRKLLGTVTKTETGYRIRMDIGGAIFFPAEEVVSIEDYLTPEQRYQQKLKGIDAKDPEARYQLAKWAMEQEFLEIAGKELEQALKLKPGTGKYSWLLKQVEAKLAKTKRPRPKPTTTTDVAGKTTVGAKLKKALLIGDEDIWRIRLAELREDDRVPIDFRNNVIERFVDKMYGKRNFRDQYFPAQFRSFPPVRKTMYILEHIEPKDTDIRKDIVVLSDPRFMIDFRARIWPVVARSCAGSRCHGSRNRVQGGLRLFNVTPRTERIDYANFAILDSVQVAKKGRKLINRANVNESLLLQFALPPKQAKFRHPVEITPLYGNRRSLAYQVMFDWIEGLAGPPHPGYDLEYRLPFGMKPLPRGLMIPPETETTPETQPAVEKRGQQ